MNNVQLLPSDTPLHVRKRQIKIVLEKSDEEKLKQCFELIEFSYNQAIKVLKIQLKTEDDKVAKFAYVDKCYKDYIKKDFLKKIKSNFLLIK